MRAVAAILESAFDRDLAIVEAMLGRLPQGSDDWAPGPCELTAAELASHLVESCAGVCACFHRLHPERLAHLEALRGRFAPEPRPVADSRARIAECRVVVAEAFALVGDADLPRPIPSIFRPRGEPFLSTLLINWKHVNHHARQLFGYLKALGVPVATGDLYG